MTCLKLLSVFAFFSPNLDLAALVVSLCIGGFLLLLCVAVAATSCSFNDGDLRRQEERQE